MKPLSLLLPVPVLHRVSLRAAAAVVLLTPLLTGNAQGQATVNLHALDAPGTAHSAPARHPAARRTPAANARTEQPATAQPTTSASGGSQASHPSATSRLAEDHAAQKPASAGATAIPALPTQQPVKPSPATTAPNPATSPLPLPPSVRLVFEAGKTELTPADEAAIQDLARAIPAPAADSVNVVAYAAGKADDPSTARRLSLSRGLAVRSVLLASGVPSAQIYVRALGSTPSNGPADRVELIVAPIGTVVTR
jgi:outer membrane protein OmpA-like peptidoglycan-associated protein